MTNACCAECGKEDAGSLKMCKACMHVRYCSPACQQNHWPKHKKECKLCAAKLRDKVLFKDPPAKEDCPICFLPMPENLINCVSLPPAIYCPCQFAILQMQMSSCQIRLRMNIIHVVGRVFVEGVYTPSIRLITMRSAHFAILTEINHLKSVLKN